MARMSQEALERLKTMIADLPEVVRTTARTAVYETAIEFVQTLQAVTPKDHGDLVQTIQIKPGRTELSFVVSIGNKDAPASSVEFGHTDEGGRRHADGTPARKSGKHVPAHPFFFPAAFLARRKLQSRVARAVGKALRDGAGVPELRSQLKSLQSAEDNDNG